MAESKFGPKFEEFYRAYLVCAVWASTDEDGSELDVEVGDFSDDALCELKKDCLSFWQAYRSKLVSDPEQAGHDFWLTRNRHGSGFWDGGWPKDLGAELTTAAHAYGSISLWVGEDGRIQVQ